MFLYLLWFRRQIEKKKRTILLLQVFTFVIILFWNTVNFSLLNWCGENEPKYAIWLEGRRIYLS